MFKPNLNIPVIATVMLLIVFQHAYGQQICIQSGSDQKRGVKDGYRYELWNQYSKGTACMTLGTGALFKGEWSGVENYLARRGLEYNQTQEHKDIGNFVSEYKCDYNPQFGFTGNSYLSVYGWTVNPLVEYYIIEDWRNWIPSMAAGAKLKGSITVYGSIYDIYENTRVNQPSIIGTATFKQYFSIRRNTRNSGVVHISTHFKKWESLGMNLGKLHEVSMVVEGYQSSGKFGFKELDIFTSADTTLEVTPVLTENSIGVYPNPSNGSFTIDINPEFIGAELKLFDSSGKLILRRNLRAISNKINGLECGNYVAVIIKQNRIQRLNLVVR
ncbi:MAG: hypothetical protein CL840_06825 [Crocinitomicaceae bacterium]|nr:hypothetical protein [Crocinitomicaceae bacterium]